MDSYTELLIGPVISSKFNNFCITAYPIIKKNLVDYQDEKTKVDYQDEKTNLDYDTGILMIIVKLYKEKDKFEKYKLKLQNYYGITDISFSKIFYLFISPTPKYGFKQWIILRNNQIISKNDSEKIRTLFFILLRLIYEYYPPNIIDLSYKAIDMIWVYFFTVYEDKISKLPDSSKFLIELSLNKNDIEQHCCILDNGYNILEFGIKSSDIKDVENSESIPIILEDFANLSTVEDDDLTEIKSQHYNNQIYEIDIDK